MASDKKNEILEDEEIIELTDVVEEAPDVDSGKENKQPGDDTGQEGDLDEDLSDLFESLSSDESSDSEDDDEFGDLFKDKDDKKEGSDDSDDQDDDDFLKDFLGEDEDDQDAPAEAVQDEQPDIGDTDIDELVSDLTEDTPPSDEPIMEEPESQPDTEAREETEVFDQKQQETEEEPEPVAEPSEEAQAEQPDFDVDEEPEEALESAEEKPAAAVDVLAEQLESLSDRLDMFEERIVGIENSFFEKTIEAVEQKGLELSFVQGLTDNILKQVQDLIDERVSETAQSADSGEEPGIDQRIQDIERRLDELSMPDTEELKKEILADLEEIVQEKISAQAGVSDPEDAESVREHDPGELMENMENLTDDRINSLIESWQKEKKALATELEDALKFWGKMQEKMTELSQDIGELKDGAAAIDPELREKIESFSEQAVTREDIRNLASQIKAELEEYVIKKAPEAAAKVIREEIAAMVREKK